ncbi:MAG: hypothetical protein ACOCUS_02815 [Polyangiales bacterium]
MSLHTSAACHAPARCALAAAALALLAVLVPAHADDGPTAGVRADSPHVRAAEGPQAEAQAGTDAEAAVDATDQITPARLRSALARYRHEPGVDAVVDAALEAAGADPARARRLAQRARNSGWVPELRAGVRHGQGRDLSEREYVDGDRTNFSTDDQLTVDGSLTFDLGRIVFASQEVSILREQRALRAERAEVIETVVRLYYERRRLQLERDLLGARDLGHAMRIAEAEAMLNAFTDGAFERMMDGPKRGTP